MQPGGLFHPECLEVLGIPAPKKVQEADKKAKPIKFEGLTSAQLLDLARIYWGNSNHVPVWDKATVKLLADKGLAKVESVNHGGTSYMTVTNKGYDMISEARLDRTMATTRIYEDHTNELKLTVRPGRANRKHFTLQVDGTAGKSLTHIPQDKRGGFSFELTTKQAFELGAMLLQAKIDDLGRRGLHTLFNAAKNAKRPTGE